MSIRVPIVAILIVATAFAGCFANPQNDDDEEYQVSRSHTILLNAQTARDLEAASTAAEALRTLVDTSLVVRVKDAGDYTLSYVDENGRARNETLSNLQPGSPRAIEGADPFGAATLYRGATVVAMRAPLAGDWWKLGDVPLGLGSDAPATAQYAYQFDARADLEIADIEMEEGMGRLDSLVMRLALPATGELGWTLSPDGLRERLDIHGKLAIDDTRGSLFFFEATGSMTNPETGESSPGQVGMEVLSGDANVEGRLALFLDRTGHLVAAQPKGGSVSFAPEAYMWATGPMAEAGEFPCAGSTRADRCVPEQMESFSESDEGDPAPREFGDDVPRITDDEGAEALEIIERLFAMDLAVHDMLTVRVEGDAADMGLGSGERGQSTATYTQTLQVTDRESVAVPAGSFDAFRIVQEVRVQADITEYGGCSHYAYPAYEEHEYPPTTPTYSPTPGRPPTPQPVMYSPPECAERDTYVRNLHIDEVLAQTTIWLDTATFQPVKGIVESPLDLRKLSRAIIDSIDRDVWTEANLPDVNSDRLTRFDADSRAEFVATELSGTTRFSPFVGMLVGTMMAGSYTAGIAGGPGMMGLGVPPRPTYGEVHPSPAPMTRPTPYLHMYDLGPQQDGIKSWEVSMASEGASWHDFQFDVASETVYFDYSGSCDPGYKVLAICGADGFWKGPGPIERGDVIRLRGFEPGQTLRVIETYSNTVVSTHTI